MSNYFTKILWCDFGVRVRVGDICWDCEAWRALIFGDAVIALSSAYGRFEVAEESVHGRPYGVGEVAGEVIFGHVSEHLEKAVLPLTMIEIEP